MRWPWQRRPADAGDAGDTGEQTRAAAQRPRGQWRGVEPLQPVGGRELSAAEPLEFVRTLSTRWQVPPALEPLGHEVSITAPAGQVPVAGAPVTGYPDPPELVWAAVPEVPAVDAPDTEWRRTSPRVEQPEAQPVPPALPRPEVAAAPLPAPRSAPADVRGQAAAAPQVRDLVGDQDLLPLQRARHPGTEAATVAAPVAATPSDEAVARPADLPLRRDVPPAAEAVAARTQTPQLPPPAVAGPRRADDVVAPLLEPYRADVVDLAGPQAAASPVPPEAPAPVETPASGPGGAPSRTPPSAPSVRSWAAVARSSTRRPWRAPAEHAPDRRRRAAGCRAEPSRSRRTTGSRRRVWVCRTGSRAGRCVPRLPILTRCRAPGSARPPATRRRPRRAGRSSTSPRPASSRTVPPPRPRTCRSRAVRAASPGRSTPADEAPADDEPDEPDDAAADEDPDDAPEPTTRTHRRRSPPGPSRWRPWPRRSCLGPSGRTSSPLSRGSPGASPPRRRRAPGGSGWGRPLPRPASARPVPAPSGLAAFAAASVAAAGAGGDDPSWDDDPGPAGVDDVPSRARGGRACSRPTSACPVWPTMRRPRRRGPLEVPVDDADDLDDDDPTPSADEIYEQVRTRLRHELMVDRERAALLVD